MEEDKNVGLVTDYINKYNIKKPKLKHFKLIARELKLQRKASTLYVYYKSKRYQGEVP